MVLFYDKTIKNNIHTTLKARNKGPTTRPPAVRWKHGRGHVSSAVLFLYFRFASEEASFAIVTRNNAH